MAKGVAPATDGCIPSFTDSHISDRSKQALNLFPKITELDGVYRLLGIDICNDS
jgi:hypothetical protein